MDWEIATRVSWIRNRILWKSESCWLLLKDGLVTLRSEDHGLIFSVPLAEVRASFPKVFPPLLISSIVIILTVRGQTYKLSFVPPMKYAGWNASGFGQAGGTGAGPTWSISDEDMKQAKGDIQLWRTTLEQPTNGGH